MQTTSVVIELPGIFYDIFKVYKVYDSLDIVIPSFCEC